MMNASDSNLGSGDQESSIIEEGSKNNNCKDEQYKEGQSMNNNKEGGIQTESNTENTKDIHESNTVNKYDVNITTSVPAAPQDQSEQLEATNEEDVVENYDQQAMQLNIALEALESMRRLNLECEFSGSNTIEVDHDRCTYCQREEVQRSKQPKPSLNGNSSITKSESGINIGKVKLDGSRLRRFGSNMSSLFSKASSSNISDDDNNIEATTGTTQSCPPTTTTTVGESSASICNNGSTTTKRRNLLKKTHHPCLTCGHPTCSKHSSSGLSKQHIPICQPCAYLFELDFLVDVITNTASNTEECKRKVDDMVDCYDRAKILLEYTSQYADDIAAALETNTVRSNKIGAGSSATGVISGVAGVVGCGALLFPPIAAAGVPLLVASLVFGGGATAAQTGDAAAKYFSEPNRLAEKMVALHAMVLSLLRITEVLSYGLLKSHLNVNYSVEHLEGEGLSEWEEVVDDVEDDEVSTQREELAKEIRGLLEKHGVATTKGMGALQGVVTSGIVAAEVGVGTAVAASEAAVGSSAIASGASVVGRGSRYFGRVGTTAANSARFIPLVGGVLSAACVVVEGRELKKTLERISEGNPCALAEQVRTIKEELNMLPDSSLISAECKRVFELAQKEKERKEAASALSLAHIRREEKEAQDDVSFDTPDHGDLSNIIDVLDTKVQSVAMQDKLSQQVEEDDGGDLKGSAQESFEEEDESTLEIEGKEIS